MNPNRIRHPRVGDTWSFGIGGRKVKVLKMHYGVCGQWTLAGGKLVPFGSGKSKCIWVTTDHAEPCSLRYFMRYYVFVNSAIA